jgi:WD40 repeat protein
LTEATLAAPPTPFKGLAPFGESELDTLLFFGREREIEVIAANLVASRLTILYGPSGVGKTSLLRAGVVTRLRNDEGAGVLVLSTWSSDPIDGLLRAMEEEARRVRPGVGIDFRGRSLADALADWSDAIGGELYVVLDQFEEYFLYHESGGPFDELAEIIRGREHRANFLISIREDALAQLDAFKTQLPNLFGNSLRLDLLDRLAATRAIVGPLERYNELAGGAEPVVAEDELVEEILDSVRVGQIQLGATGRGGAEDAADSGRIEAPYLQLVLERLWNVERERGSARLRLATLHELGGATRIVEEHLERAMSILSPQEQDAAAAMYNHLVTPSGTKIAHRAGDLARYASVDEAEAGRVLDRLTRERIVRAAEDGAAGPHYEIFHDVLAGAVLAWRTQHEADRRLAEERQQSARRHRRLLALAGISLVIVAVLAGVAAYALSQRGSAQDNAREAEARAREADASDLAALAEGTLPTSPEGSLSLALEASESARTPPVERALRSALRTLRTTRVIDVGDPIGEVIFSPDGTVLAAAPDEGARKVVRLYAGDGSRPVGTRRGTEVSFGPRGRRLVTAGRSAVVSDPRTGRRLLALPHPVGVLSASFSPDSSLIATTSLDRRIRLWDARTGRLIHVLTGSDPDTVSSEAAFDRSGRRLVTWGGGPAALIYDVVTGIPTARLLHRGRITVARFAPTTDVVATGGLDKVARLWDAATGDQLRVFRGHTRGVLDVAFSDSGRLLATASLDQTGRVWDPRYATLVATLPGHGGFVTALDFSPDDELIATASRDRMARIFDADAGTLRATLAGHEEAVRAVAFGTNSRTVATASTDGTIRLWNAQPFPKLRRVETLGSPAEAVAFEGKRILSAGRADIRNRLFALSDDPRLAFPARGFEGVARTQPVALGTSENGRVLVSSHRDGTIREWRLDDEQERFEVRKTIEPAEGRRIRYTVLGVSPDGSQFVAGTRLGAANLWSATRRQRAPQFDHGLTSATFSPDGRYVLTTSVDHDARLVDLQTGQQVWVLSHAAKVSDADFSADGRWVAIAGPRWAGIVDVRTGERILLIDGHDRYLASVAFSPTGWRIATGGRSGAVRTYDCQLCGGIDELIPLGRKRLVQLRPVS